MFNSKVLLLLIVSVLAIGGCQSTGGQLADSNSEITRNANEALESLYASNSEAWQLSRRAKGILVFPGVVKAGFLVGAQYGTGGVLFKRSMVHVFFKHGRKSGFYNIVAGSYGLQVGVESFNYVMFFMDNDSLNYLEKSQGWEVGVGPTVVVVDKGFGKSLTTTTAKDAVYSFIFDQKGLMAGIGMQGSKISKIDPE
jgi:lipid-binding SYLF domain-containing protein